VSFVCRYVMQFIKQNHNKVAKRRNAATNFIDDKYGKRHSTENRVDQNFMHLICSQ